jgi:endonuclease/exonuclease/phosphatase family metal-dependent hydrolase
MSNRVSLGVTEPCETVPHIDDVSVTGSNMSVTGTGLGRNLTLVIRSRETEQEWRLADLFGVQLGTMYFRLPLTATCGVYDLRLVSEGLTQSSNTWAMEVCPGERIHVVSYNVKMLPPGQWRACVPHVGCVRTGCVWLCESQGFRAGEIANSPALRGFDVLVLQEAFSEDHRATIVRGLRSSYPYMTRTVGTDLVGPMDDGGVIILSRWPIENLPGDQVTFDDACTGWVDEDNDCLADKGVLYARVNKLGRRYHVFGTHLDSGHDEWVRWRQMRIIADFRASLKIPTSEPVFLAGDLNESYLTLDPTDHGWLKPCTVTDEGECLPGSPGTIATTPGGGYLDYVLHGFKDEPTEAYNMVIAPKTLTPEKGGFLCDIRDCPDDLSDHYAVVGGFDFGPPDPRQIQLKSD